VTSLFLFRNATKQVIQTPILSLLNSLAVGASLKKSSLYPSSTSSYPSSASSTSSLLSHPALPHT